MIRVLVKDRNGETASFEMPPGERVLHAGLAAGCGLPHECATGTCGSCRARIEDGAAQTLWPAAPGARNFRSDADVLMCQITAAKSLSLSIRTNLGEGSEPLPRHATGVMRRTATLTPDVSLFAVKLPEAMEFKAGQFVLVSLDGVDGPRAYSMTAYTPASRELSLLIRRHEGGAASQKLFGGADETHPVRVFGPLGKATYEPDENRPLIAIAGGSGIAGILAILDLCSRSAIFDGQTAQIFFGLRSPDAAYCLDELNDAAARHFGALKVTVGFSDSDCPEGFARSYPNLEFARGLIHEIADAAFADSADTSPVYFVAGPPAMVDASMRMLIIKRKIPPTDIRYDKFG